MPPLPPRGEGAIFVRGKEKFAKNGMSAAPPALTPAKSANPPRERAAYAGRTRGVADTPNMYLTLQSPSPRLSGGVRSNALKPRTGLFGQYRGRKGPEGLASLDVAVNV